jgi:chemotaxis protein CheC
MSSDLDSFERDLLLETASVAAGKTLKPIASVIEQSASIEPPQLLLTGIEHIADSMGKPEEAKTVVFVRIAGESRGAIVLLVDPHDVGQLLPHVADTLKNSALEEMTNIMAGASLSGLSKLLGMEFLQSVPTSTTDMLRAVVNEVVSEIGGNTSRLLCMIISLKIGPTNIPASMYLMFDTDSTAAIIKAGKRAAERKHGGSN